MNFDQLRKLSENNEVRIDDFRGHKRSIPYYYDSLRHAFGFYFNTFITNNSNYSFYAEGLHNRNVRIFKHQVLDEDNTVLTIIAFERFFELFLKDLLRKTNKNLIYVSGQNIKGGTQALVDLIIDGQFVPKKFDKKLLTIPFRQTITRFYDLIHLSGNTTVSNRIIKKFSKIIRRYSFLDSSEYKATFQYINWYRDRILHNGNQLPHLWLLDYTISQMIIPIIKKLVEVDKDILKIPLYYFKTITDIDILNEFCKIKFEFKDLKAKRKQKNTFVKLLKIGHLKEIGRANMNMNLFVRENRATHEYNYHDVRGRGKRFALAEKDHADFKSISDCPCCGVKSLVLYRIIMEDIFSPGNKLNIDWVKCYTCDYHLRFDTGEPYLLDLYPKPLFDTEKG